MTMVTSMFLHGGFWHIAGNMLYLFIFGAAVEYRMGALRYLIFYFAAGIAAALATVWIAPASSVPVIGASGAIAGVLGAYFILYPRGRILTILPIFIFIQFVEIPAVIYLLFWFAVQLYAGLEQSGGAAAIGRSRMVGARRRIHVRHRAGPDARGQSSAAAAIALADLCIELWTAW